MSSYYFIGQSSLGANGTFTGNVAVGGTLTYMAPIVNQSSTVTLTTAQSNTVFRVMTGGLITLPTPVPGTIYTFFMNSTSFATLPITCGASAKFVYNGTAYTLGGTATAPSNFVTIQVIAESTTAWRVVYTTGTWAFI